MQVSRQRHVMAADTVTGEPVAPRHRATLPGMKHLARALDTVKAANDALAVHARCGHQRCDGCIDVCVQLIATEQAIEQAFRHAFSSASSRPARTKAHPRHSGVTVH